MITSASAASTAPKALNITTISANAQKESTLECWQLNAPLNASATPGTSGSLFAQLGKTGATSYGLIPAEFNGGLHNAPVVQSVSPSPFHFFIHGHCCHCMRSTHARSKLMFFLDG